VEGSHWKTVKYLFNMLWTTIELSKESVEMLSHDQDEITTDHQMEDNQESEKNHQKFETKTQTNHSH